MTDLTNKEQGKGNSSRALQLIKIAHVNRPVIRLCTAEPHWARDNCKRALSGPHIESEIIQLLRLDAPRSLAASMALKLDPRRLVHKKIIKGGEGERSSRALSRRIERKAHRDFIYRHPDVFINIFSKHLQFQSGSTCR